MNVTCIVTYRTLVIIYSRKNHLLQEENMQLKMMVSNYMVQIHCIKSIHSVYVSVYKCIAVQFIHHLFNSLTIEVVVAKEVEGNSFGTAHTNY